MIVLRAILYYTRDDHKVAELVVTENRPDKYKKHFMGFDIKLNRGKIITFLSELYAVPPGDIVWPEYIEVPKHKERMSLALRGTNAKQ